MTNENKNHQTTDPLPQPKIGKRGGQIFGAHNPELEWQNPDMLTPPDTDHGTMPSLKWPYALSHTRVEDGGWSREVTTRELPESTTLAGVNMHLEPGDRKSTRLNSSHVAISYAVFCLKKKKQKREHTKKQPHSKPPTDAHTHTAYTQY